MIQEANLQWRYEDTSCGLILPWYTRPCLEWLKAQDVSRWSVFESGAGYSTVWWRLNCAHLLSVDSDERWAYAMGGKITWDMIGVNPFYVFCRVDRKEFIHFLEWWERIHVMGGGFPEGTPNPPANHYHDFDCIIIDGIEREQSLLWSIAYLKPGGYLIVDNWEDFHQEYIGDVLSTFKMTLYKQPNHSRWTTAVFQKP